MGKKRFVVVLLYFAAWAWTSSMVQAQIPDPPQIPQQSIDCTQVQQACAELPSSTDPTFGPVYLQPPPVGITSKLPSDLPQDPTGNSTIDNAVAPYIGSPNEGCQNGFSVQLTTPLNCWYEYAVDGWGSELYGYETSPQQPCTLSLFGLPLWGCMFAQPQQQKNPCYSSNTLYEINGDLLWTYCALSYYDPSFWTTVNGLQYTTPNQATGQNIPAAGNYSLDSLGAYVLTGLYEDLGGDTVDAILQNAIDTANVWVEVLWWDARLDAVTRQPIQEIVNMMAEIFGTYTDAFLPSWMSVSGVASGAAVSPSHQSSQSAGVLQ